MTVLYVRNVPEDLLRKLKAISALRGKTLSAYIVDSLETAVRNERIEDLAANLTERGSAPRK